MPLRFRILADDAAAPPGSALGPTPRAAPIPAREVEVVPADEIRLGRRPDLELPLPFAALSATHARIVRGAGGWMIEDLGSSNGTWLDDERLVPGHPRALRSGARLRLADRRIDFRGEGPPAAGSAGTGTIARQLVQDLFAGSPTATPALRVVRGAEARRIALAQPGRRYVVGRGEGSDIPLGVEEVSRAHAAFVWSEEGVTVRDLGSKNGVTVGGVRIEGDRRLRDGEVVEIGPVALRLEDPVDRYLDELAAAPEARTAASPPLPDLAPGVDPLAAAVVGGPEPHEGSGSARAVPAAEDTARDPWTDAGQGTSPARDWTGRATTVVAVLVLLGLAALGAALLFARG
jgi:pSer/pThr/pTyr-binding forkhead associated (FHA) protein